MNKQTTTDWHSADIIAALKKRGTSLAKLSREAGLASSTLANALARAWPKGEKIWPSRYAKARQKRAPRLPLPIPIDTCGENANTSRTE